MTHYFGVVEDRDDPLRLGRCKVRIIGLHCDDLSKLPTADLPWAMPMQPITSAAISGIGTAPVGVVNGTWVICIFSDASKQFPIMIGTFAGVPGVDEKVPDSTKSEISSAGAGEIEESDEVLPSERTLENKPKKDEAYLGSLTKENVTTIIDYMAAFESAVRADSIGSEGSLGLFRFDTLTLEATGYVISGTWSKHNTNEILQTDKSVWTGKNNIKSSADLLSNENIQRQIFSQLMEDNYAELKAQGLVNDKTPREKLAGVLTLVYGVMLEKTKKHLSGTISTTSSEKTSSMGVPYTSDDYFLAGYQIINDSPTNEFPTTENINRPAMDSGISKSGTTADYDVQKSPMVAQEANDKNKKKLAFADPDGKYPIAEFLDEPDTPRLSRHQKIDKTIVADKETKLIKDIAIANSGAKWSQPQTPYNAKYPYNKVMQTESGHFLEFDDTAEAERINIHHKSGTFFEIDASGTQVNRIEGHGCTIIEKDGLIHIKGNAHLNLIGSYTLKTGGQAVLEIAGSFDVKAKGINFESSGDINLKASGAVNIGAGGAVGIKSGGAVGIKGSSEVALDAGQIHLASGKASPSDPAGASGFSGSFAPMPIKSRGEDKEMQNEEDERLEEKKKRESIKKPPVKEIASIPASTAKVISSDVSEEFILPISINTRLSTNFTIADLAKDGGFNLNGQHGLSAQQIALNLRLLAVNVIEPLYKKYRNKGMVLKSGIRPAGSKTSKSKGISQHELGCAVDIAFGFKVPREEYFQIAAEIQRTTPFDQLLLEWTDSGARGAWIHISYIHNGKMRPAATRVMTYNNGNVASRGELKLIERIG